MISAMRWKVVSVDGCRWEVYRHDGRRSWFVGAADTYDGAWEALAYDRRYWLLERRAVESRPPQNYAQSGIWK